MRHPEPPSGPPNSACSPRVDPLPSGTRLWRIHPAAHFPPTGRIADDGTVFNPGVGDPTRFAPMTDAAGAAVPTIYLGATRGGALFESVLHDQFPGAVVDGTDWLHHRLSAVLTTRDLTLVTLHGQGLHSLGLYAADLTHAYPSQYPRATRWAAWLHQHTNADGMVWRSHQDDDQHAYILWGDRVAAGVLVPDTTIAPLLLGTPRGRDWMMGEAASAGIEIL